MLRGIISMLMVELLAPWAALAQPVEIYRSHSTISATTADARFLYILEDAPAFELTPARILRIDQQDNSVDVAYVLAAHESVREMLSDGVDLYVLAWSREADKWIIRVISGGDGTSRLLSSSSRMLSRIKLADGYVYWLVPSTRVSRGGTFVHLADGELRRVPVTGGDPELLASQLLITSPHDLNVGAGTQSVFLLTSIGVLEVPKESGTAALVLFDPELVAFAEGPSGALWIFAARSSGSRYELQLWELAVPHLQYRLAAAFDVGTLPPRSVEAHVSDRGSRVIFSYALEYVPRTLYSYRGLFVSSPLGASPRKLLEDFDGHRMLGVILAYAADETAFALVAVDGTARNAVVRLPLSQPRLRPVRR